MCLGGLPSRHIFVIEHDFVIEHGSGKIMTSYDSVPYPSYSYAVTDPASLNAVAKIFGLNPPDYNTANVLELGTASGGNLIPMASRYKKARFHGIDISEPQIEQAIKNAANLKLKNIKFEEKSILDVNFEGALFDYIIVHGVYSWVTSDVQQRIFDICSSYLSPQGIAYISYNTLPGWNMVKTIRDMMLYHGQNFDDPTVKITEARKMLEFVANNNKIEKGSYKQTIEAEIKTIQDQNDNYLLHDHLEVVNDPCYLHEFVSAAETFQLKYLADSDLPSMYLGNQKEEVLNILGTIPDPVRQEQYLDFITNRRFRMTLLTHQNLKINRNLSPDCLEGLYFKRNYRVKEKIDINKIGALKTITLVPINGGQAEVTISSRISAISFIVLHEFPPFTMSIYDIADEAHKRYLKNINVTKIQEEIGTFFLQLIFTGVVAVRSEKAANVFEISSKPEVFNYALQQALIYDMVPNLYHDMVKLTDSQRLIVQYVNGNNSVDDIAVKLENHVHKGELSIHKEGILVSVKDETFKETLNLFLENELNILKNCGLLSS